MASIKVSNVINKQGAQKFIDAVEGKTFMNFHVALCPAYGSFDIYVETNYTDDEQEAREMLMDLMFGTINK